MQKFTPDPKQKKRLDLEKKDIIINLPPWALYLLLVFLIALGVIILIAGSYLIIKIPVGPPEEPFPTISDAPSAHAKPQPQQRIRIPLTEPKTDLSKIVEEEFNKLAPGLIAFKIPKEMKVGVEEEIEVRITRKIKEDLTEGIRGRGEPQVEEIRVGTFMKCQLMGKNFDIQLLTDEDQPVVGEGYAYWLWDAVPLKSGIQTLKLVVAVRIKLPGHDEEVKYYPIYEREIKVNVNLWFSFCRFVENNWKFIITTLVSAGFIGGIIALVRWIAKKRKKSKKKSQR